MVKHDGQMGGWAGHPARRAGCEGFTSFNLILAGQRVGVHAPHVSYFLTILVFFILTALIRPPCFLPQAPKPPSTRRVCARGTEARVRRLRRGSPLNLPP